MTTAKARHAFALRLAAGLAGYCAFINLYSPQAILPLLSEEFSAGAAEISGAVFTPWTGWAASYFLPGRAACHLQRPSYRSSRLEINVRSDARSACSPPLAQQ